jgi:pimeloyl-ACP methyl ester carboxylesterase
MITYAALDIYKEARVPARLTGILTATAIGFASLVAPATATAAAAHPAPVVARQAAAAPVATSIRWRKCGSTTGLQGSGAQCATVSVPLDHAVPTGPQIRIAISRIRHRGPAAKYQGVMLVNPGGPGVAGLDFALLNSALPDKVSRTYDWIGFDPRGVGHSTPRMSCDPSFIGFNRPDYYPKPKANQKAWLARSQQYARACGTRNAQLLPHMTTVDNVYDIDAIRVALGVQTINYYGFSYGTYLGQVYSTLFPTHVRRQILDSNVDPSKGFYRLNLDQDVAFDSNLRAWFSWIAKKHKRYGLGRTGKAVQQIFVRTQDQLTRHPARGKLGPDEWIDTFLGAGYNQASWSGLALAFARYVSTHNPGPILGMFRADQELGDDNSFAVYNAVQCTDSPWPRHWSTWQRDNWATYRKAPLTTWMNAWFNAPCLFWPVVGGTNFAVDGSDAPPTLLIGETKDGATPFPGNLRVRSLFPRSSLVAVIGGANHANSPDGNSCVAKWVFKYLSKGTLPHRRAGSVPDVRCKKEVFLG